LDQHFAGYLRNARRKDTRDAKRDNVEKDQRYQTQGPRHWPVGVRSPGGHDFCELKQGVRVCNAIAQHGLLLMIQAIATVGEPQPVEENAGNGP
jgi:hypothetical protein